MLPPESKLLYQIGSLAGTWALSVVKLRRDVAALAIRYRHPTPGEFHNTMYIETATGGPGA
jgi:hypothetical protein